MAEPIRYLVDLADRMQHLVRVTITVPADLAPDGRLVLSVWTPGSYVVRDYVRHVQQVQATVQSGEPVELRPDGGSAWRLPGALEGPVTITFELYANDLTVRTNHVDDHHALLVGAATFPYVEGGEDRPHEVTIEPVPRTHRVHSLLPSGATPSTWVAEDRDHLIDSAFEVGDLPRIDIEVADVPHAIVWAGHGGAPDLDRAADDLRAIAHQAIAVFDDGLPQQRYTVLVTGWDTGGGGLEHRDGAVLQVPVHVFQDDDLYRRFQSLLAHEYLHLWNVKRLVPIELVQPRFDRPTYTTSLWVAEGWTAYYDDLLPTRAGLWRPQQLLDAIRDVWTRLLATPGTDRQSLRQASYDAWTKHYLRDENARNAMTDYYGHGALLAFELDCRLRGHDPAGDGLDDVLRRLWRRHGSGGGYDEAAVLDAIAAVGGDELAQLTEARVARPGRPALEDAVALLGLELGPDDGPATPWLGVEYADDDQGVTVTSVQRGGPAWRAGVTGGDRLVAIAGRTVGRGLVDAVLRAHEPGERVEVAVIRGPRLLLLPVELGSPVPRPRLAVRADAPPAAREAFTRWCGHPWPTAKDAGGSQTGGG